MITSVTFDSNVWEILVDESKLESADPIYRAIADLITTGQIKPYFFEGIATMETVKKVDRKNYVADYKGGFSMSVDGEEVYKSEGSGGPVVSDYLNENIPKALKLGFRFTRFPRIGAPMLNIPESYWAPDEKYEMGERQERSFECARFIKSLGAGKGALMDKLDPGEGGIVQRSGNDTTLSDRNYSKAFGEWVDGDALAANYGYGIDYFCTNDRASGAGSASIFYRSNLTKLQDNFAINVISPQELAVEIDAAGV